MKKRIFSIVIICIMLVSVLFSVEKVGHYVHDCSGEHCHVCEQMHMAANFLNTFSCALIVVFAAVILLLFSSYSFNGFGMFICRSTLITQKVKLSD